MIEPLPNARSICETAASSALVLSTDVPSTRRRFAWLIDCAPSDMGKRKSATRGLEIVAAAGSRCAIATQDLVYPVCSRVPSSFLSQLGYSDIAKVDQSTGAFGGPRG